MAGSVIIAGARTPIGKLSGALASLSATDLGGIAIKGALERAGITGDQVDFVFMGHVLQANAGRIMLVSVVGFGACMIGFGLSTALWLSASFLLLSGVFDGISVVLRSTVLQLATPDEMRGRVSSVNGLFVSSSNELGAFYSGAMARLLNLSGAGALLGVAGAFQVVGEVHRKRGDQRTAVRHESL